MTLDEVEKVEGVHEPCDTPACTLKFELFFGVSMTKCDRLEKCVHLNMIVLEKSKEVGLCNLF